MASTYRILPAVQLTLEDRQRFEHPLLFAPVEKAFWISSAAVALLCALTIGWLSSKLGTFGVVVAAASAVWFVLAIAILVRQAVRARGVPFRAGVYAFSSEVIDATGPQLRIYSLRHGQPAITLTHVSREHHGYLNTRIEVALEDRTFRFTVLDAELAAAKVVELARA